MLIFLSKAKSTHYVFSTICYSNSIYICVLIRRKYFNGWWVSWYNIFLYILNSFFSLRGFFGWFFFVKINIVSSTYVLNILRILNDNMESTQSLIASNVIHYVNLLEKIINISFCDTHAHSSGTSIFSKMEKQSRRRKHSNNDRTPRRTHLITLFLGITHTCMKH